MHQLERRGEEIEPLAEERALLRKEGLEGGEVEDLLIDLHLPEVRQDGRLEGEVAGQVPLGIAADGEARPGAGDGTEAPLEVAHAGQGEGAQLEAALRRQVGQVLEAAVARHHGGVGAGDEGPLVGLLPERR